MRKFVPLLVIVSILFSVAPVFAQELRPSVSLQSWFVTYEQTIGGTKVSDSSLMFGPTLTFDYDDYYTSVSYTTTTNDYSFDLGGGDSYAGKKTDIDLTIGYRLGDNIALHGGWKHNVLDMEHSGDSQLSGDITTSGPAFGVTGHVPVADSGLTMVGDFTAMYLITKVELGSAVSEKESQNAFSMQLGVNYRFTQSFSVNAGYTHQIYVADDGNDTVYTGAYLNFGYTI